MEILKTLTVLFDKNGFQDLLFDDCHGCETEEVLFYECVGEISECTPSILQLD